MIKRQGVDERWFLLKMRRNILEKKPDKKITLGKTRRKRI